MRGTKAKLLRKAIYGKYPKSMAVSKISLWSFFKSIFQKHTKLRKIGQAWGHRKWWNKLGHVNPYYFREYIRLPNGMLREQRLRGQYQHLKREYKLYGPMPKGEMI